MQKQSSASKIEKSLEASKEDDFDLFGSSDEEKDEEKEMIKQQRLKAYAEKKAKKPGTIAKSSVILDVKVSFFIILDLKMRFFPISLVNKKCHLNIVLASKSKRTTLNSHIVSEIQEIFFNIPGFRMQSFLRY